MNRRSGCAPSVYRLPCRGVRRVTARIGSNDFKGLFTHLKWTKRVAGITTSASSPPERRRLPRERRDAGEVARRDRLLRRDPRAADRNDVGQRQIVGSVRHADAAGRTELEVRERLADALQERNAADRL